MPDKISKSKKFKIKAEVWLYPGMAGWHFVSIPKKESQEIKEKYGKGSRGFRSLPVTIAVGKTSWKTSIFPDKQSGTYLLPLKADVRKKEGFGNGDHITFSIKLTI